LASYQTPGVVELEMLGETAVLRLLGEHDLATKAGLEGELRGQIDAGRGVVVSLADTEFIDSSVLKVLFETQSELSKQGKSLVLHVNTTSIVRRVLDVVRIYDVARCTTSLDEAVKIAAAETRP
jgi:anti-anti-sigma factor